MTEQTPDEQKAYRERELAEDEAVRRLKRSNDRQVLNGNLRLKVRKDDTDLPPALDGIVRAMEQR